MSGFGIASEKVPTMKSQGSAKNEANNVAQTAAAAPAETAKVDFSNVKVEPLFEEEVDFDTFSKSDFRAVKVKECVAVPKSKKLLQFTLDDGTGTDRTMKCRSASSSTMMSVCSNWPAPLALRRK